MRRKKGQWTGLPSLALSCWATAIHFREPIIVQASSAANDEALGNASFSRRLDFDQIRSPGAKIGLYQTGKYPIDPNQ
jgi:hypothetical protein